MEQGVQFRLVAGLGNPGKEYENTRHNVGFLVADELARRGGVSFSHVAKWNAEMAKWASLAILKPATFMNLSGESVGDYSRFYKLDPGEILVVIDDAALPLGGLRLRRSGSSGGHNGLESVMVHLGTDKVPRLRVGIGSSEISRRDHVLGRFSADERAAINQVVARAADAIEYAQQAGFEAAMNQFN